MPFKSEQQRKYLYAKKPKIAKKLAEKKCSSCKMKKGYKIKNG